MLGRNRHIARELQAHPARPAARSRQGERASAIVSEVILLDPPSRPAARRPRRLARAWLGRPDGEAGPTVGCEGVAVEVAGAGSVDHDAVAAVPCHQIPTQPELRPSAPAGHPGRSAVPDDAVDLRGPGIEPGSALPYK